VKDRKIIYVLLYLKEVAEGRRIFYPSTYKNPHPFGEPLSIKGHKILRYCSE
jgi:hypothetical protein